jgi:hypothetical protein
MLASPLLIPQLPDDKLIDPQTLTKIPKFQEIQNLRSSLYLDITQRRSVIGYQRFGTACYSHHQGSSNILVGLFEPSRW